MGRKQSSAQYPKTSKSWTTATKSARSGSDQVAIRWKGKGQRSWFGLTLDKFAMLAEEQGRPHKK